jgi:hypothetical protein
MLSKKKPTTTLSRRESGRQMPLEYLITSALHPDFPPLRTAPLVSRAKASIMSKTPLQDLSHGDTMAKQRSKYQERAIRNYYENRDGIMLQRLGELVTDLFLAEGQAKVRLWKRVAMTLEKLKVPKDQIQHLVQSDNPTLVANVLKKLLEESA